LENDYDDCIACIADAGKQPVNGVKQMICNWKYTCDVFTSIHNSVVVFLFDQFNT